MMFPFMTIYPAEEPLDVTEITYSDLTDEGKVLIYFERWNAERDAFDSMQCYLPDGKMEKIVGFTEREAMWHHDKIIKIQDMLIETAREDTEEMEHATNA